MTDRNKKEQKLRALGYEPPVGFMHSVIFGTSVPTSPDVFEVDGVKFTADDGSATLSVIWCEPGQMMARLDAKCRWHPSDDRIDYLRSTSPDVYLMQVPDGLEDWIESDRSVERLFRTAWREYMDAREP